QQNEPGACFSMFAIPEVYTAFTIGCFSPIAPPSRGAAFAFSPCFQQPKRCEFRHGGCTTGDERKLNKTMKRLATFLASAVLMIPAVMQAKPARPVSLQEAVRHQLATMSRYTAFDDISFRLE